MLISGLAKRKERKERADWLRDPCAVSDIPEWYLPEEFAWKQTCVRCAAGLGTKFLVKWVVGEGEGWVQDQMAWRK